MNETQKVSKRLFEFRFFCELVVLQWGYVSISYIFKRQEENHKALLLLKR